MNQSNKQRNLKHQLLAGATLIAGLAISSTSFAGSYGGNCVPFQLSAYGGEGGVRTLDNPNDFRSTRGRASGQFCGNNSVRIELSKRDQHTEVVLHAGGYDYVFPRGDRGNRHQNNWFRKYITINLPNQQHYDNGYDSYNNHGYNNHGYDNKHYKKRNKHKKRYRDHNDATGYGYRDRHDDRYYDKGYGAGYGYGDHYDQPRHHGKRHAYKKGYKHGRKHARKHGHGHRQVDYVDSPHHSHGHGIAPKPRLRIGSKIHRKAHRLHLPHRHKRAHVAYH